MELSTKQTYKSKHNENNDEYFANQSLAYDFSITSC